jgi:hypothetical protein
MQDDAGKKSNQSDRTAHTEGRIEELAPKPISDRDAQSVKGGRAHDDESPKESKAKI